MGCAVCHQLTLPGLTPSSLASAYACILQGNYGDDSVTSIAEQNSAGSLMHTSLIRCEKGGCQRPYLASRLVLVKRHTAWLSLFVSKVEILQTMFARGNIHTWPGCRTCSKMVPSFGAGTLANTKGQALELTAWSTEHWQSNSTAPITSNTDYGTLVMARSLVPAAPRNRSKNRLCCQ